MYRLLFVTLLVSLGATQALAQSSSAGAKEWKGFYAGGNVSASRDKADAAATLQVNNISGLRVGNIITVIVPGFLQDFAASRRETNWGGGFQAGYHWQGGRFVFGPEADFNPFHRTVTVSQNFSHATALTPSATVAARRDIRLSGEFSLRARAGVAFGKTLIYGTGGYAQARVRVSVNDSFINPGGHPPICDNPNSGANCSPGLTLAASGPVITTASESQNMGRWAGGVGFEHKFGARVSVGFEYRHTDLRDKTFALSNQTTVNTGPPPRGTDNRPTESTGSVNTGPTRVSLKSDSFGVRVNFHF